MKKQLLVIIICLISSDVFAAEKISFGSFPIPLMVVDKNTGVFVELTKEIAKRSGLEADIVIAPPKRILNYFLKKEVDALVPALDVNFPTGITPVKCPEIIYVKTDYVFTRKRDPLLRSMGDLENKKVGITLGYPYARELTANNLIQIDQGTTDEINVKKLIKGRFDAFVVEEKSGLKAFESLGVLDKIQYDPELPLSRQDVYYAFQDTPKGRRLSALVAKTLKGMKQDGTFERIMNKSPDTTSE